MNYKKILKKHKNSRGRGTGNDLDRKRQKLIAFLRKNAEPEIYKNFHLVESKGEHYLLGYSNTIGISKKNSPLVRTLMSSFPYQSPVTCGTLGGVDNGMAYSFSGIDYNKQLLSVALNIAGNEREILVQVPVSDFAPLLLLSRKTDYVITIAPMKIIEK